MPLKQKGTVISWQVSLTVLLIVFASIAIVQIYSHVLYKFGVISTLGKIKEGTIKIVNGQTRQTITEINKGGDQATVYVWDEKRFFNGIGKDGEVGIGEMYTDGIWTCDNIWNFLNILIANMDTLMPVSSRNNVNAASVSFDSSVVQHHYDVGNDFYATFLKDDLMTYSCGFFFCPTDTLNDAQHNKVNMIIRKMNIASENNAVLDIGCGWGKIAEYVAKHTNSFVVGTTISNEQVAAINQSNASNNVKGVFCHYLDMPAMFKGAMFDKVYSIGMFEHVRCSNYIKFFESVNAVMKPGARFVLHTITTNRDDTVCESGSTINFVTKHIFPGGQIPKIEWVLSAAKRVGLQLVHLETFGGHHYAKTLKTWRELMLASQAELKFKGYTEKQIKAYKYYMLTCEIAFWNNHMQLSHFVFDKIKNNRAVVRDVFIC